MVIWGIILAFGCMIMWAVSDLVAKIALKKISHWRLLFWGQLIGGVLLLPLIFLYVDFSILFSGVSFFYAVLLGFINLLGMHFFYKSLHGNDLILAGPINYSWAFITVILAAIFFDEIPNLIQFVAILSIIFGVGLVSIKTTERKIHFNKSLIYALFSMVIWGIYFFLLEIPVEILGAIVITFTIKILSPVFVVPVMMKEKISLLPAKNNGFSVIVIIAILDTAGFLAYNFALNYAPVYIVAPIATSLPVMCVLLGMAVLKERISFIQGLGIFASFFGLIMLST